MPFTEAETQPRKTYRTSPARDAFKRPFYRSTPSPRVASLQRPGNTHQRTSDDPLSYAIMATP